MPPSRRKSGTADEASSIAGDSSLPFSAIAPRTTGQICRTFSENLSPLMPTLTPPAETFHYPEVYHHPNYTDHRGKCEGDGQWEVKASQFQDSQQIPYEFPTTNSYRTSPQQMLDTYVSENHGLMNTTSRGVTLARPNSSTEGTGSNSHHFGQLMLANPAGSYSTYGPNTSTLRGSPPFLGQTEPEFQGSDAQLQHQYQSCYRASSATVFPSGLPSYGQSTIRPLTSFVFPSSGSWHGGATSPSVPSMVGNSSLENTPLNPASQESGSNPASIATLSRYGKIFGEQQTQILGNPPLSAARRAEKITAKRKRAKKSDHESQPTLSRLDEGSNSDSDFDDTVNLSGTVNSCGVTTSSGKAGRPPGACTHCKKLKMKCDFSGGNTCKRCKAAGLVCVVEGRRPRIAPNKREFLLAQIKQKDVIIESLLKQLHSPYTATPMSIASYKMATCPSDSNNRTILDWLERIETGLQKERRRRPLNAVKDARRGQQVEREDESYAQRYGLVSTSGSEHQIGDDEVVEPALGHLSLPDSHFPLGLFANLSLNDHHKKETRTKLKKISTLGDSSDNEDVGVANQTYFMPGPASDLGLRATLIEQHSPPDILAHGLVLPEDVDKLFAIYYERIDPFISLLDPALHTPTSTFSRCPFLFTVVCAISSRFYKEKSEIYPIAMHFSKRAAANALIDGWKTVELCQAYILMSIYSVPAQRWEEDKSWLYAGLAIRLATDLNLHQVSAVKALSKKHEREILNQTRVWMICFNLDRLTATQFGKPSVIREDYFLCNSRDWYKSSESNLAYDIHLCAYTDLLRTVSMSYDQICSDPTSLAGVNDGVGFFSMIANHEDQLTNFISEWNKKFEEGSDPNDPASVFRCSLLPFIVGYSRLVILCFAFQQAYQRGIESQIQMYLNKCLAAAKLVIMDMIERLAPSGYMRYAPDGHFVFVSFASAFLIKLLQPRFTSLVSKVQEEEIATLIERLVQTFSSPDIAIDDRHTPKIYARFLTSLLSRHRRDGNTDIQSLNQNPPSGPEGPSSSKDMASLGWPSTSNFQTSHAGTTSYEGQIYGGNPYMSRHVASLTIADSTESIRSSGTQSGFGCRSGKPVTAHKKNFDQGTTLVAMQALENPAWWKNVMMPGFSWPDSSTSSGRSSPVGILNSVHQQLGVSNGTVPLAPALSSQ